MTSSRIKKWSSDLNWLFNYSSAKGMGRVDSFGCKYEEELNVRMILGHQKKQLGSPHWQR